MKRGGQADYHQNRCPLLPLLWSQLHLNSYRPQKRSQLVRQGPRCLLPKKSISRCLVEAALCKGGAEVGAGPRGPGYLLSFRINL